MGLRSKSVSLLHLSCGRLNLQAHMEISIGSGHPVDGTSHEDLSQFPDYINADHRYWSHNPSGETHHAPTGTSTFGYGMPDLPETGLTPNVGSGVDPGAVLGGTSIPFQAKRFGSTSHITSSIPAVEGPSHMHPRPSIVVPI